MACSRFRIFGGIKPNRFVGGRSAHVGELLFLDDVDVEIAVTRILADDHAFVDLCPGRNKDDAALLQIENGIAGGVRRSDPQRANRWGAFRSRPAIRCSRETASS